MTQTPEQQRETTVPIKGPNAATSYQFEQNWSRSELDGYVMKLKTASSKNRSSWLKKNTKQEGEVQQLTSTGI